MMPTPPEQEPLYAVAAQCLARLAEFCRGAAAASEAAVPAPSEDPPDPPFSRIIGFLSESGDG